MITINEMCKYVYPFIKPQTPRDWIRETLFRPQVYVPPPSGPGTGSQLSISDLVTVGLLHVLFSLGVKFKNLKIPGKGEVRASEIIFQREIAGAPKTDSMGFKMPDSTWVDEKRVMELGRSRAIQLFLEEFDYHVILTFRKARIVGLEIPGEIGVGDGLPSTFVRHYIYFFPGTQSLLELNKHYIDSVSPYEAIVFLNANHWRQRVKLALGE
ncbi:MAG: hypothetical protein ACLPVO_16485 [Desulfomonilaceae bacterium]